jgi:hypothetical protein
LSNQGSDGKIKYNFTVNQKFETTRRLERAESEVWLWLHTTIRQISIIKQISE